MLFFIEYEQNDEPLFPNALFSAGWPWLNEEVLAAAVLFLSWSIAVLTAAILDILA